MCSAKELDHYERVRKTFDSSGDSKNHDAELKESPPAAARELPLHSKPKYKNRSNSKGKGKGKAPIRDMDDFQGDDTGDDEGQHDYKQLPIINGYKSANGSSKGKGAIRDLDTDGFGDPSKGDEEELYG